MNAIYIIGVFLTFFISVLLFTKKEKSLPDMILAVWACIMGGQLLNFYLNTLGYWETFPHLVGITAPFPLFHGPFLYLYVLYSLKNKKKLHWKDYLHFMPAIISYIYMFDFIFNYTPEQKRLIDSGELNDFDVFTSFLFAGFAISAITYPILSYRLLGLYNRLLKANFSYDERINLRWLRSIILGLCAIFLTAFAVLLISYITEFDFGFRADNIFYGLAIVLIILFGYHGVRQQNIFTPFATDTPVLPKKAEYEKSGLKTSLAEEHLNQLLNIMAEEKPYLDSKLTLSKLASMINISSNNLSQIINQYKKVNFHDFVNKYRVEEFKIQAKKNPDFSILALAFESGFNSKSSFNAIFKKQTGQTPTQYLSES